MAIIDPYLHIDQIKVKTQASNRGESIDFQKE